jgi:hypothetical protein
MPTPVRRPSPSRSNLGTGSHSTYHAPTTKAHGTPSVAIDYGRRSTRRAVLHAVLELPRPQTSASSRRFGSASLPTTRVQSGGASWWSQRTNHHGSTRRTLRGHVESRATLTVPKDGWRSSAKQYLRAPRPTSRVQRGRAADVQQPSGQLGCVYGMSPAGQSRAMGRCGHGLPLSRHNPSGREERGVQVCGILIEPALA